MLLLFAWRYIKGKKSTQAIQIISWVSVLAMSVGTAALLIVLSVFNGFEDFIKQLYSDFYPQVKVAPIRGKTFAEDPQLSTRLQNLKGIRLISRTLEEKVLFSYDENQVIATLKGVDTAYQQVTGIQQHVRYGHMDFSKATDLPPVVLGIGLSNRLGASDESVLPLNCYSFRKGGLNFLDMSQAYNSAYFTVSGVFGLQEEIDNQFALAPLEVVQSLSNHSGLLSSYELRLAPGTDEKKLVAELQPLLEPAGLKAATRYEQNRTLYFILSSERWAVFAILTLMLIIASFNIIGSLSMLVLEKQKDISILKTMGMTNTRIRSLFLSTGVLLSLIGACIGCLLAIAVCSAQQYFGFVKLGQGDAFLLDAYPVKMVWSDFALVMLTVVIISALASIIPSVKASRKPIELRVK